jgi:hypothetical protein
VHERAVLYCPFNKGHKTAHKVGAYSSVLHCRERYFRMTNKNNFVLHCRERYFRMTNKNNFYLTLLISRKGEKNQNIRMIRSVNFDVQNISLILLVL